jgi:hypothetical protein
MTRIITAALCLTSSLGVAQTSESSKTPGATTTSHEMKTNDAKGTATTNGMSGWTPRKVTHEDKKGIDAMLNQSEKAWKTGDIAATAALVDFPVYMVTDNSKGVVSTDTWTKDQYMTSMTEAMKNMPKDMKVKHNRKYDFLTDDMAMVYDNATMTMGKQTMNVRSASLVIKKDGKWMVKSMMEGGWGDSMAKKAEPKG